MKTLTTKQLRELRIYNAYDFGRGIGAMYLDYYAADSRSVRPSCWCLTIPSIPNPNPSRWGSTSYEILLFGVRFENRLKPEGFREHWQAVLDKIGWNCNYPGTDPWVKCLGAWWPKLYYDARMAKLVKRYQEMKEAKNDQDQS